MKKLLFTLCLCLLTSICFSQNEKVFYYKEYSEKYNHTYVVLAKYVESETDEKSKVYFEINGFRGKPSELIDEAYRETQKIARTDISLKVNSKKKDNTINESKYTKDDGKDRATYILKTSLDTIDNPLPPKEESDMGNFQLLWALIPEININNGVMLATVGKDSVMLKALDEENTEDEPIKSEGAKFLSEYGTMHFLFEEVYDSKKPNQYNKVVARISEETPNNFVLKIHYQVWKGKNKKKLKEKLGDAEMVFKITDIDMSVYERLNSAKLTVELDKENTKYNLMPNNSNYEGYFMVFTIAMKYNENWLIDPSGAISLLVNGNRIYMHRNYDIDNFLED